MKVLLSLFSRNLRTEKTNPKNYPFSVELVNQLKKAGFYTVQVKISVDQQLPVDEVHSDLATKALALVIKDCDTFVCVDNFIQHYATFLGKRGVVIFSRSDPKIFGHPTNTNLLKGRQYLRDRQFATWEEDEFVKESFVSPEVVVKALQDMKNTNALLDDPAAPLVPE